jgi:cytochrome oxidase Cu insertion factor (SCO1/SenC/PrrC family)
MTPRTRSTLITVALVALVVASAVFFNHLANGFAAGTTSTVKLQGEIVIDKPLPAPGFTLKDQHGQTISLSQFKGRPVLLIFLDSFCPHQDCPLELDQLGQAARDMGDQASQVAWVGLSVNVADTPASTIADLKTHNVQQDLHWLIGTQEELKPVWDAYGEYVAPDPNNPGGVVHSDQTFILDKSGRERVYWGDYYLDHRMIAADLKALLAE